MDEWQKLARGAMFNRYANNEKRAKEKKMFDAEAAKRRILSGREDYKDSKELPFDEEKHKKAHAALKNYMRQLNKPT